VRTLIDLAQKLEGIGAQCWQACWRCGNCASRLTDLMPLYSEESGTAGVSSATSVVRSFLWMMSPPWVW